MFNSSMKIVATLTGTLWLKGFEYIENFIKLFINFLSCVKRSPSRYHFRRNSEYKTASLVKFFIL